ncbi:MAG: O-antigen ligase family protein [Terracidiphilus sp.]|jgi:hypothetical protein
MRERIAERPSGYAPRHVLLALALFLNFRTFQYFPGMAAVEEAWFILCFLAFAGFYPLWKLQEGLRFTRFELYTLAVTLVLPILPALGAYGEFGQPLVFGLLAQRSAALVAGLLLLLIAIRSRAILVADLERALLIAAWTSFFLFSAMQLLLDPSRFSDYQGTFVLLASGKYAFRLPSDFLLFGVIYYTLRGLRTKRKRDYVLAFVLFVSIIGGNGSSRMLCICLLSTVLIFLYRWRSLGQSLAATLRFSAVLVLLVAAASLVNPAFIVARGASFSSAFQVVHNGAEGDDASANLRLIEILAAAPYLQKHPLLGSGELSHQWQGGPTFLTSGYFNDSDIGLFGIVFAYGVLGLLFFACQYRYALRAARILGAHAGPLGDAAKGFLVFSAIDSVTTGAFVFNLNITLFFILVLSGIASQMPHDRHLPRETAPCNLPELAS